MAEVRLEYDNVFDFIGEALGLSQEETASLKAESDAKIKAREAIYLEPYVISADMVLAPSDH